MTLVQNLKMFNRRERYFVIDAALGNPEFQLGDSFRLELASKLGLNIP